MKKLFFISCFSCLFRWTSTFAYLQQGFSSYQETNGSLAFVCETQCVIILWPLAGYDSVLVTGPLAGDGQFGYGFLVGQQIYPGETVPVQWVSSKLFTFATHPLISQLPKKDTQLVLIARGNVQTSGVTVWLDKLSLGQNIRQWWTDFWTNEPLRPYSINLRYGVKILWTSLVKIGYRLFVIACIASLLCIHSRDQRRSAIIFRGILLVMLFSLRNLRNRTDWTTTGLRTYTHAPEAQKSFFDLGDYPVFIDKMRTVLQLDQQFGKITCTIYFDAFQERPFKVHADTVYIKPCEPAIDKTSAEYIVYYKKAIGVEAVGKEVLLDRNGSFLVRNK